MRIQRILKGLLLLTVVVINIGCDQISKNLVRQNIEPAEQITLLDDHLTLTNIENTGAFLGIGSTFSDPIRFLLLTILPIIVLGLACLFLITNPQLSNTRVLAAGGIVGGGVGNIYDRLLHGSVTDFMHIDFGIFRTGIFNMADVSIMVGVFILLFGKLIQKQNGCNSNRNEGMEVRP